MLCSVTVLHPNMAVLYLQQLQDFKNYTCKAIPCPPRPPVIPFPISSHVMIGDSVQEILFGLFHMLGKVKSGQIRFFFLTPPQRILL